MFNNYDFCIKHHIFGKGITNNEIFLSWFSKFENGNSYHNEITQLPNVTEFFIIKPMVISNSIACFPQGQIREVLWEIGFVKKGLEEGRRLTLSLEGFNEEFIVLDICERAIG